MAAELRHAVTDADRQTVAPAEARAVTARAGLRRRDRQPRVEIEFLAEGCLFRRVGIFLRERDRCRPLVLCLHRIDSGRSLRTEIDAAGFADDDRAEADAGKAERAKGGRSNSGCQQGWSTREESRHAASSNDVPMAA